MESWLENKIKSFQDEWKELFLYADKEGNIKGEIPEERKAQGLFEQIAMEQAALLAEAYADPLYRYEADRSELENRIQANQAERQELNMVPGKKGKKRRIQRRIDRLYNELTRSGEAIKPAMENIAAMKNCYFLNTPHFFCFAPITDDLTDKLGKLLDPGSYVRKGKRYVSRPFGDARKNWVIYDRKGSAQRHHAKLGVQINPDSIDLKFQAIHSVGSDSDSLDVVYRVDEKEAKLLHLHYKKPITWNIFNKHFGKPTEQGKFDFEISIIENARNPHAILEYSQSFHDTSLRKFPIGQFRETYVLAQYWNHNPEIAGGNMLARIISYVKENRQGLQSIK